MTTRRSFLKAGSVLTAGVLFTPEDFFFKQRPIGLQLYTIRDAMGKDVAGSLAKVSALGFKIVEGATYTGSMKFYGMEPEAFKNLLKQNNLSMPSSHYMLGEQLMNGKATEGTILHNWDKAVDDASKVGIKYMVCAYLFESERVGLDHYKYVAEQLNKAGERCKKNGIQLCYHNHDFEFVAQNNQLPYDILLNETDKNLVKMELDLYWVNKAGKDANTLFEQNPGRFPLFHLKDMDNTAKHGFTEVGSGVIDFKKILDASATAGMKYFFVEQDQTPGDPFVSIKKSIDYIKRNLV